MASNPIQFLKQKAQDLEYVMSFIEMMLDSSIMFWNLKTPKSWVGPLKTQWGLKKDEIIWKKWDGHNHWTKSWKLVVWPILEQGDWKNKWTMILETRCKAHLKEGIANGLWLEEMVLGVEKIKYLTGGDK